MRLCIETATPQVGVAIQGEGVEAWFHLGPKNRHVESLVPAIEFLCAHTGLDLADLKEVVIDVGPGLFTGLRVGLATAKAIAFAQGVPLIGLCSLDLLAQPLMSTRHTVVSIIDGRREEVFYATYTQGPSGLQRQTEPAMVKPADLAQTLASLQGPLLLTGDGAQLYAEIFSALPQVEIAPPNHRWPQATAGLALAANPTLRAALALPTEEPLYLRPPQIHEKRREA